MNMKKQFTLIFLGLFCLLLNACSTTDLNSPCPNYGAYCDKTPVNSWNYQN